jgi:citrate lyase subunit beta/citryl-CoA lyase/malyl-CoA/(S)-citramalyl-CoA lyase
MHAKALASAADVVMFDLEDSVPLAEKAAARRQVIATLEAADLAGRGVAVRINGLDTAEGCRDLLEVAEAVGMRLDTVVVPKVDHEGDVYAVDRILAGVEKALGREREVGIEVTIESARGLERVAAIAGAVPRVRALIFGVADYAASVGARLVSLSGHGENEEAVYPGHRWHFALSRVVMAAKARGLAAIDAPYGHFRDPDGLARAAGISAALGCDGKWAIHPDQIEVINRTFTPAAEEIARARRILAADAAARAAGRGAVAVDGRMVDQATVTLARRLWEQARALGLSEA